MALRPDSTRPALIPAAKSIDTPVSTRSASLASLASLADSWRERNEAPASGSTAALSCCDDVAEAWEPLNVICGSAAGAWYA